MRQGSAQEIVLLETPEHLAQARELLREYAAEIASNVCLGTIATEIEKLPGDYGPPGGMFFLALLRAEPAGCAACRRIENDLCEMKRLYVRPACRGVDLGRRLAEAVLTEATLYGYTSVRLDTLPSMIVARSLYRSLGCQIVRSSGKDCDPSVIYFERRLR